MSYVNILHAFWVRRETCAPFFGPRKILFISHFCPMSSQIVSYINIFGINRKLLAQATDVKYVYSLTNYTKFYLFVLLFSVTRHNAFLSPVFFV